MYSTTGLTILIYTVTRFVCVNPDRFDWFNIYNRLPAFSNIFHVFILTWLGQLADDKKTHVFVVSIFYTLMCSSTDARSAAFSFDDQILPSLTVASYDDVLWYVYLFLCVSL